MRKIFWALLWSALAFACVSCSEDLKIAPEIGIKSVNVEANTITCVIMSSKATACAYAYVEKGGDIPSAEQILQEGGGVSVAAGQEMEFSIEGLEWDKTYVVVVAAVSADGLYAVDSAEAVVGEDPVIGASIDLGECANCYIVPEAGVYSFATERVSGSKVRDIASAGWIWASGSGVQDLVSDISYKDGRIFFTASGKRGNVVIAAFDESGKIVWSWHIWCTEVPETRKHDNGSVFQDRWLGAYDTEPGMPGAFGLLYQWGRKDPFFGGTDSEQAEDYEEPPFVIAVANTVMNPEFGLSWKVVKEGGDLDRGVAEPTHYFQAQNKNWLTVHNETLWAKKKTDYDPCPAGWRVPTSEELSDLLSSGAGTYDAAAGGMYVNQNGVNTWWQGAGNRDLDGFLTIFGQVFSWTSTVYAEGTSRFSDRLIVADFGSFISWGNRGFAQTVRCVAE